jgi:hypothetical protein
VQGFRSSPNARPLFNSLAGFALEVGDRLTINGDEVIFKGWVDQSQTAIEVKGIGNDPSSVRQIRAKEIKSLWRSQSEVDPSLSQDVASSKREDAHKQPATESLNHERDQPTSSDYTNDDKPAETASEPEEPIETPKEPEYNAWEVWTYLERQRVKTLKLINTFQAEWEANRFVREAERSAPPTLRVHYEIRPVWLDEAEINRSRQYDDQKPHKSQDEQGDVEDYADAIDVEIIM